MVWPMAGLHTGFDSTPGELGTEMILQAAELRVPGEARAFGAGGLTCGARAAGGAAGAQPSRAS